MMRIQQDPVRERREGKLVRSNFTTIILLCNAYSSGPEIKNFCIHFTLGFCIFIRNNHRSMLIWLAANIQHHTHCMSVPMSQAFSN